MSRQFQASIGGRHYLPRLAFGSDLRATLQASLPEVPAADTSSTEVGDNGKAWQVVAFTDRHLKLPAHVIIGAGSFPHQDLHESTRLKHHGT